MILASTCWVYYEETGNKQLGSFQILTNLPKILCLLALAFRFFYVFVHIMKERRQQKLENTVSSLVGYDIIICAEEFFK